MAEALGASATKKGPMETKKRTKKQPRRTMTDVEEGSVPTNSTAIGNSQQTAASDASGNTPRRPPSTASKTKKSKSKGKNPPGSKSKASKKGRKSQNSVRVENGKTGWEDRESESGHRVPLPQPTPPVQSTSFPSPSVVQRAPRLRHGHSAKARPPAALERATNDQALPGAFAVSGNRGNNSVVLELEDSSSSFFPADIEPSGEQEVITAHVTPVRHPPSIAASQPTSTTVSSTTNASMRQEVMSGPISEEEESLMDENKFADEDANIVGPAGVKKRRRIQTLLCALLVIAVLVAVLVVVVVVTVAGSGGSSSGGITSDDGSDSGSNGSTGSNGGSSSGGSRGGGDDGGSGLVESLEENPLLFIAFVQWGVVFDSCAEVVTPEITFECGDANSQYVQVIDHRNSQTAAITCEKRSSNHEECEMDPVNNVEDAVLHMDAVFMVACSTPESDVGDFEFRAKLRPLTGNSCGRANQNNVVVGEASVSASASLMCLKDLQSRWEARHISQCVAGTNLGFAAPSGSQTIQSCSAAGDCEGSQQSKCTVTTQEAEVRFKPGDLSCFLDKDANDEFRLEETAMWEFADEHMIIDDLARRNHLESSVFDPLP